MHITRRLCRAYDTHINDNINIFKPNEVESDEEKDETQDQEKDPTSQIGSLREALIVVKDVRKYISSIVIQRTSRFSKAAELENALIHEMTMHQGLKQAKVTDFFNKC